MNELHLFAGGGGGILGGMMLGHTPVCAVEIDRYCREILYARQQEGLLPEFPIFEDIRKFDGEDWRGRVDVVAGGFPCQDVSVAGKRVGLAGARSGLWWEMHRVICEVGPRYVFVENVPGLLVRGFDEVLGSLAEIGFDAEWCVLSAADVGAPHLRERLWILAANAGRPLADASSDRWQQGRPEPKREPGRSDAAERGDPLADANGGRQQERGSSLLHGGSHAPRRDADGCGAIPDASGQGLEVWHGSPAERAHSAVAGAGRRPTAPAVRRVADGLAGWMDGDHWRDEFPPEGRTGRNIPNRVARLKALGNGQVPQCAAAAFRILMARLEGGA